MEKKKQFTLVELIIVIVVIAILVAIAMLNIGDWRKEATKAAIQSNIKNIQTASDMYNLDGHTDSIGLTKPTIFKPSGIDFNKTVPDYLRAAPNKGKYWIDSNHIIWGATISPPVVSKEGNTYKWTKNPKTSTTHVYEVVDKKKLVEVSNAAIKDNTFEGETGKEYLFSDEDELGLETVPVGEGEEVIVDEGSDTSLCANPLALNQNAQPINSTNFVNKQVNRSRTHYDDVIKDKDGNYLAVGGFDNGWVISTEKQMVFDKYDKHMNLMDSFTLNLEGEAYLNKVIQNQSGNYVAVGKVDDGSRLVKHSDSTFDTGFIIELDKNFNSYNSNTSPSMDEYEDYGFFLDVVEDKEGNFMVLADNGVLKYNSELDLLNQKLYGENIQYHQIEMDSNGDFLLAGNFYEYRNPVKEQRLTKMNSDLVFEETVKTNINDYVLSASLFIDSQGDILLLSLSDDDFSELTGSEKQIPSDFDFHWHVLISKYVDTSSGLKLEKIVHGGFTEYNTAKDFVEKDGNYLYADSIQELENETYTTISTIKTFNSTLVEQPTKSFTTFAGEVNGLFIDGESYILFQKPNPIDEISEYTHGSASIGLFKNLDSTQVTLETLNNPNPLSIDTFWYEINLGPDNYTETSSAPLTLYPTGYNKETNTVDMYYANSVIADYSSQTNPGIYLVDENAKLTNIMELDPEDPATLALMEKAMTYSPYYSESQLTYISPKAPHYQQELEWIDDPARPSIIVNFNCYPDTYFVDSESGDITYIDKDGNAVDKGKLTEYMTVRDLGENPLSINLYFYHKGFGYIDLLPKFIGRILG